MPSLLTVWTSDHGPLLLVACSTRSAAPPIGTAPSVSVSTALIVGAVPAVTVFSAGDAVRLVGTA